MKRFFERNSLVVLLGAGLSLAALTGCAHTAGVEDRAELRQEQRVDIGYGSIEQSRLTGSVASVDVKASGDRPVTHVEELLEGRVAGVRVIRTFNGFKVEVRGHNTINGSSEPLYVIDGIPVMPGPGGGVTGLNPGDIANITVLKDASSTAIYGVRGANGVVLIKTKRTR